MERKFYLKAGLYLNGEGEKLLLTSLEWYLILDKGGDLIDCFDQLVREQLSQFFSSIDLSPIMRYISVPIIMGTFIDGSKEIKPVKQEVFELGIFSRFPELSSLPENGVYIIYAFKAIGGERDQNQNFMTPDAIYPNKYYLRNRVNNI